MEIRKVVAPWTVEEVQLLNKHQLDGKFHPYTCLYHSNLPLVATGSGWICKKCSYTQNWAHQETLDLMRALEKGETTWP